MSDFVLLGTRIAGLRKQHGEIQETLADAVGIARGTLASIERGIDRPGLETLTAIADHYKVSMDWLLGRKPTVGPLGAEVVDDPDEIAWLDYWRCLDHARRIAATDLLQIRNRRSA